MRSATERQWARRVAQWRASGLTSTQFAAVGGYSGGALRYWASRLAKPAAPTTAVAPIKSTATTPTATPKAAPVKKEIAMARVLARLGPSATPSITIEMAQARVAVRPGFDRATLRSVLEVLGAIERDGRR